MFNQAIRRRQKNIQTHDLPMFTVIRDHWLDPS
jgi:hypothetical protein